MGLNETLDRLAREREVAGNQAETPAEKSKLNDKEREYAERIFFEKELRYNINPGMSEDKIKGRIAKAISTAKMLYNEIYGQ